MLTDPSIEKLKEKGASPYDVAVLVSKRARQLTEGAQPMVDDKNVAGVVSLACREVAQDKVVACKGNLDVYVPITREERLRREEEQREKEKKAEEARLEREAAFNPVSEEEKPEESGLDSLFAKVTGEANDDSEFEDDDQDIEPSDEELAKAESEE
jgi:DNA-directed RNA polymerase omega subunit